MPGRLFTRQAAAGIAKMPIGAVVRAAVPWLTVLIAFLVLITYVPRISTVLPDLMF